jgi:hypothetical protein
VSRACQKRTRRISAWASRDNDKTAGLGPANEVPEVIASD